MPTISMFLGIIIKMYWDDHVPPHFHALYAGDEASYDFQGNRIAGSMPARQEKLITAWALLHEEELAANWQLAKDHEQLFRIDPLR